jgi:hypothetical protein
MTRPPRTVTVRWRANRRKWEVDSPNPPGVRPRRAKRLFESEEAAQAYAAEVARARWEAPQAPQASDITLAAYAAERIEAWRPALAARTVRTYVERLCTHILPALGGMRVRDIRRRHVIALLGARQRAGDAPDSVRLIRATLVDAPDRRGRWRADHGQSRVRPIVAVLREGGRVC